MKRNEYMMRLERIHHRQGMPDGFASIVILSVVSASWAVPAPQRPQELVPVFGEVYRESAMLQQPEEMNLHFRVIGGVEIPFLNEDEGLRGVRVANGAGKPLEQTEYEAAWLRMQGVNHVRTTAWRGQQRDLNIIEPKTAHSVPIAHWFKYFETLEKYGITFTIDNPSVRFRDLAGFLPESLYAGMDDHIMLEDGKPGYFYGGGATGNIYDPKCIDLFAMKEQLVTRDLLSNKGHVGIQMSNEPLTGASYDAQGRLHWQHFLRELFGDSTPGTDSNGDGQTFNQAYSTDYEGWDEVEIFTSGRMDEEGGQPARLKCRLFDYWVGTAWANYQQKMAQAATEMRPELYVAMSSNGYIGGGQDLSTIASLPSVRGLYRNIYVDPTYVFYSAAVAHAFGKPLLISEANVHYFDSQRIFPFIAASLPYTSAYEWFTMSYRDDSLANAWGLEHNIVNWWIEGNWLDKTYPEWKTLDISLYHPAQFDSRWEAFVKFAPFVSRFFASPQEQQSGILWLITSHPMTYPSTRGLLYQSHAVTDQAMMISKDVIDLQKYPVVIVFTPVDAGLLYKEIYDKLNTYVRAGGTLIFCPASFCEAVDIQGRPCAEYWGADWVMAETERSLLQLGKTAISEFEPYIVSKTNVELNKVGIRLNQNGQGEVVYKIPLPPGGKTLLLESNHIPWDEDGGITLYESFDGRLWNEVFTGGKNFAPNIFHKSIDLSGRQAADYYLKYVITRNAGAKTYEGDNWYWLSPTARFNTHVRGLRVDVLGSKADSGRYECRIGSKSFNGWGGGHYFSMKSSAGCRSLGSVRTPSGVAFPLAYEEQSGNGKIVYINQPDIFNFFTNGYPNDVELWQQKFDVLSGIVEETSGCRLPCYRGVHVYKGKDAVLANYYAEDHFFTPFNHIEKTHPQQAGKSVSLDISVAADAERMVVFDTFSLETVNGPCIQAAEGQLKFKAEFEFPWSFHLWVAKPYGMPVLLYADGTFLRAADISNGLWDEKTGVLSFDCVDRAFVSSPIPPKKVTANGKPVEFYYDSQKRLIQIKGDGFLANVEILFPGDAVWQ